MDNTDNVRLHRPHEGGGTTRAARNASPGRFSFLRGQLLNFDIAKHKQANPQVVDPAHKANVLLELDGLNIFSQLLFVRGPN